MRNEQQVPTVAATSWGGQNQPIASELADGIIGRRDDPRLKWQDDDKTVVRALLKEIFPRDSGYKETISGAASDCGWRWQGG